MQIFEKILGDGDSAGSKNSTVVQNTKGEVFPCA
jgi:hypothetical protein